MKKRAALFILAIVCAFVLGSACLACGNDKPDTHENLIVRGIVYFSGTQSVTLAVADDAESSATFKESVSTKDISLSGALIGKSVRSVAYVNSKELELVLDGTVKTSDVTIRGKITVSHSAMGNNANSVAYVNIDHNPKMVQTYHSIDTVTKTYVSSFVLPYGAFIELNATKDNISTDTSAEVSAIVEDGVLTVTVTGFVPYESDGVMHALPIVKLAKNVTTFNKELSVRVGDDNFAEYILV